MYKQKLALHNLKGLIHYKNQRTNQRTGSSGSPSEYKKLTDK